MNTHECHGRCEREYPDSELTWVHPMWHHAHRSDGHGLDIGPAIVPKGTPGAVPYCPSCLAEEGNMPDARSG